MINIRLICLGKIKEKYLNDAISEYMKRLSKFCKLEIIELPDEKLPTSNSISLLNEVKEKEANIILSKLEKYKSDYVICLDETGIELSSEKLASKIENIATNQSSSISFIIGGSLGLANKIKNKANYILSFSKLTFPHQLFRVFVLEQLFRCFKILNNEQYHH